MLLFTTQEMMSHCKRYSLRSVSQAASVQENGNSYFDLMQYS